MFTPNVIPNKHTANGTRNDQVKSKVVISVEYKIKRKFTFFRQIPNIFHLMQ